MYRYTFALTSGHRGESIHHFDTVYRAVYDTVIQSDTVYRMYHHPSAMRGVRSPAGCGAEERMIRSALISKNTGGRKRGRGADGSISRQVPSFYSKLGMVS